MANNGGKQDLSLTSYREARLGWCSGLLPSQLRKAQSSVHAHVMMELVTDTNLTTDFLRMEK